MNVLGDSHPSPRKGLDRIPFKQQPCRQPACLNGAGSGRVVQQFFRSNLRRKFEIGAVTVLVADAIEEQGKQDFGEAVVTADGDWF